MQPSSEHVGAAGATATRRRARGGMTGSYPSPHTAVSAVARAYHRPPQHYTLMHATAGHAALCVASTVTSPTPACAPASQGNLLHFFPSLLSSPWASCAPAACASKARVTLAAAVCVLGSPAVFEQIQISLTALLQMLQLPAFATWLQAEAQRLMLLLCWSLRTYTFAAPLA